MMKSKKLYFFILIAILVIYIFPNKIYADLGPKPSVNIVFEGIEGPFYVSLLSKDKGIGPWSSNPKNNDIIPQEVFNEFLKYQDDYKFIGYIQECTNNVFEWSYYAPSSFKILIYLQNQDKFIISKPYTSYSYHSYFKANIHDYDFVSVKNNHDYLREIFMLFSRIIITIVAELLIAIVFKIRKLKDIKTVILANILTQGLLNLSISILGYKYGFGILIYILFIWIVEIAIFYIEGSIYKKFIKDLKYPYTYSFIANLITYIMGLYLSINFPFLYSIKF